MRRRLIILWHTSSFTVHPAQIVLGSGIPLFGRAPVPLHRRLIILWHAFSYTVHVAQIQLGTGIPLFGRAPVPLHCRLIILWHTSSFTVHVAQIELGSGIPLFGKGLEFTQCGCVISPLIGGEALIEISIRAQPRAAKQQGKDQAEYQRVLA